VTFRKRVRQNVKKVLQRQFECGKHHDLTSMSFSSARRASERILPSDSMREHRGRGARSRRPFSQVTIIVEQAKREERRRSARAHKPQRPKETA